MIYLLAITLLIAPAYVIKFTVLGYPANVLMTWVALVWLIFAGWVIAKKQWGQILTFLSTIDIKTAVFSALFFLSGFLSLFVRGFDQKKIGQFMVLFLQPISLFLIFTYLNDKIPDQKTWFVKAAYLLLGVMGIFSIIQYFTLAGLPPQYWGNAQEPRRALGFFVHPNFYALFSAPLLAFLIADLGSRFSAQVGSASGGKDKRYWFRAFLWLLGVAGLILSLSRAGWLGLAAAAGAYFLFAADKKIKILITGVAIVCAVAVLSVPNFRWRIITPFRGETSANSRVTLWKAGWAAVKSSPVAGLGLLGFGREYRTLVPNNNLDTHNYPHNIFLDLWVETGVLGLISFIGLLGLYVFRGLKNKSSISLGVSLFLIAMVFQGFIDNPYFKNDLALVFWMLILLAL